MNEITQLFAEQMASNEFFQGGFVLAVMGTAFALLRGLPAKAYHLAKRRFTVTMEIRDKIVLEWLSEWLADQSYGKSCRLIAAGLAGDSSSGEWEAPAAQTDGYQVPKLYFAPGRGNHIFRYKGRFFWLNRDKDDKPSGGKSVEDLFDRERIMLRTWGSNGDVLRSMLAEAVDAVHRKRRGRVSVFVNNWSRWEEIAQGGRSLDSVILRAGVKEALLEDVEAFLADRSEYERLGKPYRRNYLLYGPPGAGKSTIVEALATYLGVSLYMVNLSSSSMTDNDLFQVIHRTLPGSVILYEDVDALFLDRKQSEENRNSITFSGFLNIVDGVAAQRGRIAFFTTNHIDRLDAALLRRGRTDRKFHLGACDGDQLERFFLHFFPGQEYLAQAFAFELKGSGIMPCDVQDYLVMHRSNPEAAFREGRSLMRMREAA